jgi:hypothetical protein
VRVLRSLSVLGLLVPGLLAVPALAPSASADPKPVAPVVQELPVAGVNGGAAAAIQARPGALGTLSTGGGRTVVLTEQLDTSPYAVAGLTWAADSAARTVQSWVRTRTNDRWSEWQELDEQQDEGPDDGTVDTGPTRRDGTEALWVGEADGVQARVDVLAGPDPRDLRLSLVDPGSSPADANRDPFGQLATASSGAPIIRSRAAWGADESIRKGSPSYASSVYGVTVHHTASSNDYSPEDVPRLLRGFYAYHVKSNGWSDLGYNLVVDKFGRIWEGRAGGTSRPVIGAHAGGFNTGTVGITVIGTYESVAMSSAAREAVAQLTGWRLGLEGKDPESTVRVYSAGSTRYPKGTLVTLPRVFGHRDVSKTTCPGAQGMAALPGIRTRSAEYASGVTPAPEPTPEPKPEPVQASPDGLQVSAPATVAANSTVTITVKGGAGGADVEVWFSRRGDPTFSRRREAKLAADGSYRTSYVANDEYTFFAVSGARSSRRATTRVDVPPPQFVPAAPTVLVQAPPAVDAGSGVPVAVTGPAGATVDLWFRKRGSQGWTRLRQGRFDAAGRWWTTFVGSDDHDYWASSQGLSSPDGSTLAMPVVTGPRSTALGSRVELAGRARPGDSVVVESRRRGTTETLRTTLTADGNGAFVTSYAADDEYEYRPLVASRQGKLRRTTVRPTAAGAAVAERGKPVTLSGTARPGTQVQLLFRRDSGRSLMVGGRRGRDLPTFRVGRTVTADADGRWSTSFTPSGTSSWYARSDGNISPVQTTAVR